jgi:ABC-type sulfate/molybdate transport systems ATPase subunit
MIRVEQVSLTLPGFALQPLSFALPRAGRCVVTGPTGAGKTTLLELLAGLRAPNAGRINIGDREVTALPPEQRGVGLVYQHAWLFPHLSVRENVRYGGVSDPAVDAMLRIEPLYTRSVQQLSGGERQLVALARTLATRPSVLLLDEPFAAMDPALRAEVRAGVLQWAATHDVTVMLVTHDATEAAMDGATHLTMHRGALTVSGTQQSLT